MNDASTSPASDRLRTRGADWLPPLAVFGVVLVAQLALVSGAGTDIPFQDQWDVEGRELYPRWHDGSWTAADLFRAHNEHRIVWTRALALALFAVNGQWDPILQMIAGAILRASIAAGLVWKVGSGAGMRARILVAGVVALAFLPHLAWHNALWGFQSQVYFALAFSLAALGLLSGPAPSRGRQVAGVTLGGAALLAMGPAALVPVALLGLVVVRVLECRRWTAARWREAWPALVLLALALALRPEAPAHVALKARDLGEFVRVGGQVLGWPHGTGIIAACVLNVPLAGLLLLRLRRRRTASRGEDFVLGVGGWIVLVGLGAAWMRGGSGELAAGLPSRYVDFMVLLPLANAWSAVVFARELAAGRLRSAPVLAGTWGAFALAGWLGGSAEAVRGLVVPRFRDREAPIRILRAFQASRDPAVFSGQPLLLVPHPNLESVRAVLEDPRLRGSLPPSLQPAEPLGALSRAARLLLGHQIRPQ